MVDNKILKHKYLFFFLVFVFSMMFGMIDSQAAEDTYSYYLNLYGLQGTSSSSYYNYRCYNASTSYKLAFVYAGKITVEGKPGSMEADSYYPIAYSSTETFNSVLISVNGTWTRYKQDFSVYDVVESGTSITFYSLDFLRSGGNYQPVISSWNPIETDIPIFTTFDQAENYFSSGDTTGQINKDISKFHDFSQDVYNPEIEAPILSGITIDGFILNNKPDDFYVDLVVSTKFYGVRLNQVFMSWAPEVDKSWIYKLHYYNFADGDYGKINYDKIDINSLYNVNLFNVLNEDFKTWSVNYPKYQSLPDYTILKGGSGTRTAYNMTHLYKEGDYENELNNLRSSGQAEITYFVRYYDDNGNFSPWVRYTYRPINHQTLKGDLIVGRINVGQAEYDPYGNIKVDSDGNPIVNQTIDGSIYKDDVEIEYKTQDDFSLDINTVSDFFAYIKNVFNSITDSLSSFGTLFASCFSFLPEELIKVIIAGITLMLFVGVIKVVKG